MGIKQYLSELSGSVNHATVEHILRANKLLKNAKIKSATLPFPCTKNLSQCKIVVYSDASYNKLENDDPQGGFCIFLQDSHVNLSLVMMQSKKICRMVKSTMAAVPASCWLSNLIQETNVINNKNSSSTLVLDGLMLLYA